MLIGAANRDPDAFPEPGRIDFFHAGNSRSLALGGIHYYLGARIALLKIEATLRTLFGYFPDFRPVELYRLNWHKRTNLRSAIPSF